MARQEELTQTEIKGLKEVFAAWRRKELGKRGPVGPAGPEGPEGPAGIGGGSLPTGIIAMWSGTIATIPAGWALCDGTNSTPDLRDKFVIGAKQDDAGVAKTNVTGSLTQSGGAATHTHASGTLANSSDSAGTPAGTIAWPAGVPTLSGSTASENAHTHTYTDVVNHVHGLTLLRSSASGSDSTKVQIVSDTTSTIDTATKTDNPDGGVASGTTAAGSAHSHGVGTLAAAWPAGVPTFSGSALGTHTHTVSGSTASESSLGPYYALAFIMKVDE